jgi:hypothetical protein
LLLALNAVLQAPQMNGFPPLGVIMRVYMAGMSESLAAHTTSERRRSAVDALMHAPALDALP